MAAALCGVVVLAIILALALIVSPHIPPSKFLYGPGLSQRLLSWDGQWYQYIAQQGYHWDAATGTRVGHYQNVAFFPLFPLFVHVLAILFDTTKPSLFIAAGMLFNLLAIFAFARLSSRTLGRNQTIFATILFAAWPASCFAFMGYPVGLINLCAVIAFEQRLIGNRWRSALWCGLGTAASPMLIFFTIGLLLDEAWALLHETPGRAHLLTLAGRSLLAFSGLLGFITWLGLTLHAPLAFLSAQAAWSDPQSFPLHLRMLLDPGTYMAPIVFAVHGIQLAFQHHAAAGKFGRLVLGMTFQNTIGFISFLFLSYLALQRPLRSALVPFICMVAGYLWCSVTEGHSFIVASRLLYPCLILLLPTTRMWHAIPRLPVSLIAPSIAAASLLLALVMSGYAIT